ncbi:MAG: hypothetical protein VX278_16685, partial [Myxococcota bacterium]|nr:hypothetical protein [Myxococcota bacterium]
MILLLILASCKPPSEEWGLLSPSPQREGSAEAGKEYLLYGDYIGSGFPKELFDNFFGETTYNPLERQGESASIPYVFNQFEAPNGVEVVGGINCFGCHSSQINGQFYIGIGNAFSDYSEEGGLDATLISTLIQNTYGEDSPEWEAYRRLEEASERITPRIVTPFAGVNPAFALEEAAVQYRNPQTLRVQDDPAFTIATHPISSDVPPWWHIQKKNALYYNAIGRGDFSKLIMQICVVGVWDTRHAESIDSHFPDVLAFLESIDPPVFPGEIDLVAAKSGEEIFTSRCSSCHGTYGEVETYPNQMYSIEQIGTDPVLAESYMFETGFLEWLQDSWFAESDHAAEFVAESGYIAPP